MNRSEADKRKIRIRLAFCIGRELVANQMRSIRIGDN